MGRGKRLKKTRRGPCGSKTEEWNKGTQEEMEKGGGKKKVRREEVEEGEGQWRQSLSIFHAVFFLSPHGGDASDHMTRHETRLTHPQVDSVKELTIRRANQGNVCEFFIGQNNSEMTTRKYNYAYTNIAEENYPES